MTSKERRIDVVSASCVCLDMFLCLRCVLMTEKKISGYDQEVKFHPLISLKICQWYIIWLYIRQVGETWFLL